MKVRDVMTRRVETVSPDAKLTDAARIMKEKDIGVLPVVDGQEALGVVTDRDITVRAIAEDRDPSKTNVSDVMTPGAAFLPVDSDVNDAAEQMRQRKVRRMLVTEGNNELAGIVSLGDLVVRGDSEELGGHVLEQVCKP